MYTHERLREVFDKSSVKFIQNWCAVVIDTALDRIVFKGWDNPAMAMNMTLDEFYNQAKLALISRKVHQDALVTGNGFMMLDEVDGQLKAFYNSPDQVVVIYETENPLEKAFGAKIYYDDEEGYTYCNLYYPEVIQRYSYRGKPQQVSDFVFEEEYSNPFGRVPIIHFKADSDLINVIPIQDAINKTFSDMMVVAEFNAFRQRWMVTNADISSLKASPQSIMRIPKGAGDEEGTQIGEFEAADLSMYLDTIDKLTNSIAVISRTPKHYFMNTGANISGEALNVMETPLIKKCLQIIENFGESWIELSEFLVQSDETVVVWDKLESEQPESEGRAMQIMVGLGIPLITVLRRFGWGADEIEQMLSDYEEEKKRKADIAAQALAIANLSLEQNNNPYSIPEE